MMPGITLRPKDRGGSTVPMPNMIPSLLVRPRSPLKRDGGGGRTGGLGISPMLGTAPAGVDFFPEVCYNLVSVPKFSLGEASGLVRLKVFAQKGESVGLPAYPKRRGMERPRVGRGLVVQGLI